MDFYSTIAFPVVFEGKAHEIQKHWTHIATYETRADMEFRMSAYLMPCMPFMRARDANGEIFEVSQEQLMNFHEVTTSHNQKVLEPLRAFAKAAPQEALKTAAELVRGGLSAKHFHISPNSCVQLHHPNLHAIEFAEFEDIVIGKLLVDGEKNETEPTVIIHKSPEINFGVSPEELRLDIKSFLILLVAAITRDFWVLEARAAARTYQRRTEKERKRVGTGKDRKRVVEKTHIFIPRFQYDLASYQKHPRVVSTQARVTLSPHLVSGHLRRLPEGWERSEAAEAHAAEFGINLAAGQTFVRPHKRGEIEQLRTYRSRSALELIFAGGGEVGWVSARAMP